MKTFINFISEAKKQNNKGYFIDKDGYANPTKPITLRPIKKSKIKKKVISEKKTAVVDDNHLDNLPGQPRLKKDSDIDLHVDKISEKLHSTQQAPTKSQKKHIFEYTEGYGSIDTSLSHELNSHLIDNHKNNRPSTHGMPYGVKTTHNAISKLAKQPLGHHVHLYSGVGFNPREAVEKSKDSIIHLPAHISTTHDVRIAKTFAENNQDIDSDSGLHIIHIEAKPTDKGYHIGKHSNMLAENETIVPAGTKLKYSHSSTHHDGTDNQFHVHHFTIHSQE